LSVYNEQLVSYGQPIFEKRKEFLTHFEPIFQEQYKAISGGTEQVSLTYQSALHEMPIEHLLTNALAKDRMLQYTSVGIHKDDLLFGINGYPVKKFGSQGQQKTYLIALKLAQFNFIKKESGVPPILLLDDIFDKLDENRVTHIIKLVNTNNFGQLFISDTHPDRTEKIVKKIHQSYEVFHLGEQ